MSRSQLSLFASPPRVIETGEWTSHPVDRAGAAAYIHLIRDKDDPERMSREDAKRLGVRELAPHKRLDRVPVSEWRRLIRKHLHDRASSTGYPEADRAKEIRSEFTFNRLMLELAGVTADIAFETNADRALWELVAAGTLEHTTSTPVLFRLVDPNEPLDGVWASLDGDNVWRCHECNTAVQLNRWTGDPDGCPACGLGQV